MEAGGFTNMTMLREEQYIGILLIDSVHELGRVLS